MFRATKSKPKTEGREVAVQTEEQLEPPAAEQVDSQLAEQHQQQQEADVLMSGDDGDSQAPPPADVIDESRVEPQQDLWIAGQVPEAIATAQTEETTSVWSTRKTISIKTSFPDVRIFKNVERRGRPRKVIRVRAVDAPLVTLQPRKKIQVKKYQRLSTAYQPLHYISESEQSEYED